MRKLGFTLAEVLITLGIIGVIATLTLPTLMTNVSEREYSTALKKGLGMFTEAIQINVAMENISFDEMTDPMDEDAGYEDTDTSSFVAFLNNRMQVDKMVETADACLPGAASGTANCVGYGSAGYPDAVYFRDGSVLMFDSSKTSADCDDDTNIDNEDAIKHGYCLKGVFDVNGHKKPNLIANCEGDKTKDAKWAPIEASDDGASNNPCTKDNFVARDQYPIVFTGVAAYPGSYAAEYVFNKK